MRRFIIFLIVGGGNTILGLAIMFILNIVTHNPYFANAVAYVIGFFTSYWGHDSITFRGAKSKKPWRIVPYAIVYATAFILNYAVLSLTLTWTTWPVEVIFVVTSCVFAAASYSLSKTFVFRAHTKFQPKIDE